MRSPFITITPMLGLLSCVLIDSDKHQENLANIPDASSTTDSGGWAMDDTGIDDSLDSGTEDDPDSGEDTGERTDPIDSDGDGLSDDEEAVIGSNPLLADSDYDNLQDAEEIAYGSDPLNPDTDNDGLFDGREVYDEGTDPNQYDTDSGGLGDGYEILIQESDPLSPGDDEEDDFDYENDIYGGHFDVDTYLILGGEADAHAHKYDDNNDVVGVDAMDFEKNSLTEVQDWVTGPFKLLIINPALSPQGRLAINNQYVWDDSETYHWVQSYADTPTSELPIYSFDDSPGTIKLTHLGLYLHPLSILSAGLHATLPGCVEDNDPGVNNEWRNGALTVQAVAVDEDGNDLFSADASQSAGGVQGPVDSGFLWEMTVFWHWGWECYTD